MGNLKNKISKEVFSNKELRETLESYNIGDAAIDSLDIKLYFKRGVSYESDVVFYDLEYKDYKYELVGIMVEGINEPELYKSIDGKYKDYESLGLFLKDIEDKEIDILENYLDFSVNGESEYWVPKEVNWIDDTPDEIKEEFEKKYKESDYEEFQDWDKITFMGYSGIFFEENDNINSIVLNIDIGEKKYEIRWINKSV